MSPLLIRLVFLCSLVPHLLLAQDQPDDHLAIERTLNYYFQAVHINQFNHLGQAYHPQALFTYVNAKTGKVEQFAFGHYLSTLYDAEAHPTFADRQMKVLSVDIGGNTAWAKTAITYSSVGIRIIDFLSLVKDQGAWRIISRVSHKEYAHFGPKPEQEGRAKAIEPRAIQAVVSEYLAGRKQEDWDRMKQSFHPAAQVAYVDPRQEICHTASLPDYLNTLHADERHYQRRGEIIAIDHVGNVALVKVRTHYRHIKGTTLDYLTMVKVQGHWHIIHKATHKDPMTMNVPA
jgi:hypothetical protein